MNTTSERCNGCNGHGEVPSGYTRFHSGLMAWRVCHECNGVGTVEVDAEPVEIPASADTIIVDGSTVTAPGFTVASFQRALQRADADNLKLGWTDRPDVFTVSRGVGMNNFYVTGRSQCNCKAGQRGVGCKHRALAIFLADIGNDLPADLRRQRHAEPCGVRSRSPGWRSSA